MKRNQFLTVMFLTVLAGALAFYWYEWRITNIKKHCYAEAEAELEQRAITADSYTVRNIFIDLHYNRCLKRFGVKQ